MINNYVVKTQKGYIKWANILVEDDGGSRIIRVSKAGYTPNLQEAEIYSEEDKLEDTGAWERFLGENESFEYLEIEYKLK